MNELTAASHLLSALIHTTPEMDDIDRLVDMASYMARRLEANTHVPIEVLEATVWPELVSNQAAQESDSELRNL